MKFRPVELNNPAGTSATRRGLLSIITLGLQGGARFASNWLIGVLGNGLVLNLVASATALAFTLNTVWPSSAQSAASKFIARARGRNDDAEVHAVAHHIGKRVLQVVAVLAIIAPVLWVVLYHGSPLDGLGASAILITVATSQFARGVQFGAGQVARGTRVDLVTSVVGIGTTLVLLMIGVRSMLLTLPLTLSLGIYSLLCWPWTAHGRPDRALRREIDAFVTMAALGSVASAGMLQISQLTASGISQHAGAVYAPALQLVTPFSIVTSALMLVLYPSMAQAHGAGDTDLLRRQTDLATRAFLGVLVPLFGALAIASRPVISLLWLGKYPESALVMPALCIALMLQNIASPGVSSITSGPGRHMWFSLGLSQAGLVSAVLSWVLLVGRIGVLGVAIGYAVGAAVTSLGLIVVAWRMTGQRWWGVMAHLLIAVGVVSGLAAWRQSQPVDHVLDIAVAAAFALVALVPSVPVLRRVWAARR